MAFNVNLEMVQGIAKLTLSGELDASTASQFKEMVEKAAQQNPKRLVLIMNDLEFMASAGLRVLIFAKQKMAASVDIYVIGAQEAVKGTLVKSGFHRSVIMFDEYDAAEIESV
jgi:anti-anti-sigma factor